MFCNNCGKELEAGDLFCGYCGARQEPVPEPIVEEPAAENVTLTAEEPVQPTQERPAGTSSYEERKSPVGWIVAGIAVLMILISFAFADTSTSYTTSTSQTRTEYYNQLLLTGKNHHIPQLAQKVNSTGAYKAEYEGNKLVRISCERGNESFTWKINDAGTLEEYYQEGTEFCREQKVHAIKVIHDGVGNMTRLEHYGVDGRLKENRDGIAIYESEYDGAGNQTRLEHYGVDGRLKENRDGIAIYESEYDGAGNQTRRAFYGVDGHLKEDRDGVAIYGYEYDGAGNQTRRAFYGVDGRLKEIYGVAIFEFEYDSSGNAIAYRGYNAKGDFLGYAELE